MIRIHEQTSIVLIVCVLTLPLQMDCVWVLN